MRPFFTVIVPLLFTAAPAFAWVEGICNLGEFDCGRNRTSRSASANPSSSSRININPSAVPTEKGLGVEVIGYKGSLDAGLVRGLGRVGAAISPSNSEDTFFGAPAYELYDDFSTRKLLRNKYRQQKTTLATAFNLFEIKKSAIRRASLNLGVLGKYNSATEATTPGAGLNGVLGPFTFGYSVYRDETLLIDESALDPYREYKVQSIVENYSFGLYLNSLIIDYSTLRLQNGVVDTVELITASVMYWKLVLSASQRREVSSRPGYNFREELPEWESTKVEYFYGLQMKLTGNFMVGVMYNYYLLREISGSMTLMF